MPNWCTNNLYVSGNKEDIARFRERAVRETENIEESLELTDEGFLKITDKPLCLNNFVPMPKKYDKGDKWYGWRIKNWGTKWEISGAEIVSQGRDFIQYMFDTAWSPPIEWLKKVAKEYPKLDFELKYREDGMGFCGKVKASKGKIILDEELDTTGIYNTLVEENILKEGTDEFYEEYDNRIINALEAL